MNIIEAAKEAGFRERNGSIRVQHSNGSFVVVDEQLERFAAIIRAQALEEAAAICKANAAMCSEGVMRLTLEANAAAIESLKGTP